MKTITVEMLRKCGACYEQVNLFRSLFGDCVEVTEDAAVAVADRFNWDWAAENFLPAPAWEEFERVTLAALAEYYRAVASARDEFDRVTLASWAEFDRVVAAALDEYDLVTAAALAEFDRVVAPARAEFKRVTAPAWAELRRVKARTFARLYREQEEE